MYTAFYGLREKPFVLSPNPRFLYLAESHREALAHLLYGLGQGEGFIVITGEVGTGKTTICRSLLQRLGAETELGFLFNPSQNAQELLQSINEEFDLPTEGLSRRELLSHLNHFLLERKSQARRVVLIVDEAQNLSRATLEQVRLLSNLETESSKLIQIILLGQPELDDKLESHELRQLRQRIGVRWRLDPLTQSETLAYVRYRVGVAAGAEREIFTDGALREVHRCAGGVPRLINVVCDRALLSGYAGQQQRIGAKDIREAASELPGLRGGPRAARRSWRPMAWTLAATLLLIAGAALLLQSRLLESAPWQSGRLPGLAQPDTTGRVPTAAIADVASRPVDFDSRHSASSLETSPLQALAQVEGVMATSGRDRAGQPDEIAAGAAVVVAQPQAAPLDLGEDSSGEFLSKLLSRQDGRLGSWEAVNGLLAAFERPALDGPPGSAAVAMAQLAQRDIAIAHLPDTSFDLLRQLDYPALLDLKGSDGVLRTVALVWLDGEVAELIGVRTGGTALRVSLAAVEDLWTGSADVAWRRFEPISDVLEIGETGRDVMWLQSALLGLGFYDGELTGIFGLGTRESVRSFQREFELDVDGVAGPLTQMILYGELEQYALPRLTQREAG